MLTASPVCVDGCDPISFKVAIQSTESDPVQAIKSSVTKSSYGISQAQLLESEDDSDVIIIEGRISEHDEEAEAEREYAMEMARQATQLKLVTLSDDLDEEDLAAPTSDSIEHHTHLDDERTSDVDLESLPMGQGRPSSELGEDSNHQEMVFVEDSDEDEEEDEVEEDSCVEEELDEFDEEEHPEVYCEEDIDEDGLPDNAGDHVDDYFSPPPPPVRFSQRKLVFLHPDSPVTQRPAFKFEPPPSRNESQHARSLLLERIPARRESRAKVIAHRHSQHTSSPYGVNSHSSIVEKSLEHLGARPDGQEVEIGGSPLPSPPQSDQSDASIHSEPEPSEEEEGDGEEDEVEGGQWAGDTAPLSDDEESVESVDKVSDCGEDEQSDVQDSVPRFVQLPSPELFADAESEIRALMSRHAASVASGEEKAIKKRPRVEEEEAVVAKVLPCNASFEYTDSPSERTTLVDAPVKMDASTSTRAVIPTSTPIVPLDSIVDKTSSLPSDVYPTPPKRRRINYKQIALSSTVGFVAGATACFVALGALGDS